MDDAVRSPFKDLTAHIFPPPEVAIIGAGIAGLVAGAIFERAKIPYVILEKRAGDKHLEGADIAMYPSSMKILHDIGIPDSFWPENSKAVTTLHLCKAVGGADSPALTRAASVVNPGVSRSTPNVAASSSTPTLPMVTSLDPSAPHDGHTQSSPTASVVSITKPLGSQSIAPPVPMKTINLANVVGDNQALHFTNRRKLTLELQKLVPRSNMLFGITVVQLREQTNHVEVIYTHQNTFGYMSIPVVLGCDGIRSVCRQLVQQARGGEARPPRYAGEICYRGSFQLRPEPGADPERVAMLEQIAGLLKGQADLRPGSLSLYYGKERRSSWGYLNETGDMAYWWAREPFGGARAEFSALQKKQPDKPEWPFPLRTLYRLTEAPDFYLQPIVDRESDKDATEWYSNRCVLVGDAAHPMTPELFQGANLAVEDAALLATMLSTAAVSTPSHVIFAEYSAKRIKHVTRIQKMSYSITTTGQSSSGALLRDTALKLIPARLIEAKLRKTTSSGVLESLQLPGSPGSIRSARRAPSAMSSSVLMMPSTSTAAADAMSARSGGSSVFGDTRSEVGSEDGGGGGRGTLTPPHAYASAGDLLSASHPNLAALAEGALHGAMQNGGAARPE
ncbi:hypothetical protein GGF31_007690 [Allomyces arbusculus]|nr:hypothetical protein GGF31_007690 [Allomyces arbusculus]